MRVMAAVIGDVEQERTRIGHGRAELSRGTQRRAQRHERGSNMVAVLGRSTCRRV